MRSTAEGKAKARTIEKALRNGKISKDEAFVEVDGKADLRAIPLAEGKIAGAALEDVDLSYSDLSGAWIERSTFNSAIFDAADLSGIADHGNSFDEARFVGTDFRKAALGYEGSRFRKCHFEKCKFKRGDLQKHSILNLRDYAEPGTSLDFPKRLKQLLTDTRDRLGKGRR